MGMNLECMLYLQQKGLLTPEKKAILDIGPQNVYFCTTDQIMSFVLGQGGDITGDRFSNAAKKLEYFSTPRKGERTTFFSEIADLTGIEYKAFDVCPAPKTELLDLNFDRLPAKDRNYYDVVLNFGTTEHVFNQWNSFALMHEALKPGGVLYCVLPASGYLDHGYYCYTPLFFKDLAKANGYKMVDMFVAQAGESRLKALNMDMRRETQFLQSNSARLAPDEDRIWSYNIHVVMKKTTDSAFRCALEVATSHADANAPISARYSGERSAVDAGGGILDSTEAVARLVAELDKVYASRSWRITRPLRTLSALLQGRKMPARLPTEVAWKNRTGR
jgi:SAM-dependent methyltransferase